MSGHAQCAQASAKRIAAVATWGPPIVCYTVKEVNEGDAELQRGVTAPSLLSV